MIEEFVYEKSRTEPFKAVISSPFETVLPTKINDDELETLVIHSTP